MKNRTFITLCLLAFLIVSCKPGTTGPEVFRFAFLTDIHVQPEKGAADGFRLVVEKVNELAPDFVVTGGDLIMDALAVTEGRADSLYSLYNEIAEGFNMPVYNSMGNHEVFGIDKRSGIDPSHPLYGEKMYEEKIGDRFYSFNHKGWRFYIIDSVDDNGEGGYFGQVDSAQMAWLNEDLQQVNPSTPLVVVTHIPLITVISQMRHGPTAANTPGIVVTNARDVLDIFLGHNLALVLQGHLHFLEEISAMGTRFITGGAVCASWWNGPRNGMEEGFVMVEVKGNEFTWEYIDYGWEVVLE